MNKKLNINDKERTVTMARSIDAKRRAVKKYDEAHKEEFRNFYLRISKIRDADIVAQLESKENIQGYIKDLIRKDMTGGN